MQPESTPAIAPEALEKKRSRRLLLLGVACLLGSARRLVEDYKSAVVPK